MPLVLGYGKRSYVRFSITNVGVLFVRPRVSVSNVSNFSVKSAGLSPFAHSGRPKIWMLFLLSRLSVSIALSYNVIICFCHYMPLFIINFFSLL